MMQGDRGRSGENVKFWQRKKDEPVEDGIVLPEDEVRGHVPGARAADGDAGGNEPASGLGDDPPEHDGLSDGFEDDALDAVEFLDGKSDGDDPAEGSKTGQTDEDPEDSPSDVGRASKLRSLAGAHVDTDKLRNVWRGNSVGRTAFLAIGFYVLAAGSVLFFVVQPASTRLHEVKGQKEILHDYMVIQQAGAAIGSFKEGLMTGDQRLTVLAEITQMAEVSGVRVVGDPELLLSRDARGSFSEYPMRIRARGTFHEIGNLLSLLESSPRFVVVEEVEIRSEIDSRSGESEVTLLLTLPSWEG
jgi:hypothetical protein